MEQQFLDNIEKRRIQLNMTLEDLDHTAALEYECFVQHRVKTESADVGSFPMWDELPEEIKFFYRHRAVRDV